MLNADSGILEENVYPASSISLHKYRLLYYLGNVKLLRGVTGRICCTLAMKYVRELLICLLYYAHMNGVDVMTAWPIHPHDVVRLTQYTCLFRILKGSVKNMVLESPRGSELLAALLDGVWSQSVDATHHGQAAEKPRLSHRHSTSMASIQLKHGEGNCCVVSSFHPSFSKTRFFDQITVKGADGLRVLFDRRCCLDSENASLTFFHDDNHSEVIARFTGDSPNFCTFTVRGDTLRYVFDSNSKARPTWGFAFTVQPFRHIRWNGDQDVMEGLCFDWNCFALNLIMDVSRTSDAKNTDYFRTVMKNLILYMRSSGMPFKSRVVDLLIKLRDLPCIGTHDLPDVTLAFFSSLTPSGMYDVVLHYCGAIDSHSLVPAQLPLLIEFLASYRLAEPLAALSVRDADPPLPPFQADPRLEVASSQQGSEEKSEQANEKATEQTTEQTRTSPETNTNTEEPSGEHMPSGEPSGEPTEPSFILSSAQIDTPTPSLRATIDTLYLLTRCLYYQSMPPQPYLRLILHKCGQAWTAYAYAAIARCYRRFTRRTDLQLIAAFEQSAKQRHFSMLTARATTRWAPSPTRRSACGCV
ncbi:hypothetical protein BLSTO_05340 [Blastocystis sp. subtype 1]